MNLNVTRKVMRRLHYAMVSLPQGAAVMESPSTISVTDADASSMYLVWAS